MAPGAQESYEGIEDGLEGELQRQNVWGRCVFSKKLACYFPFTKQVATHSDEQRRLKPHFTRQADVFDSSLLPSPEVSLLSSLILTETASVLRLILSLNTETGDIVGRG